MARLFPLFILLILLIPSLIPSPASRFSDSDISSFGGSLTGLPAGEKIALWAERFVGTPYDTDPMGEYVTRGVVVADERVDCMYLAFRAAELGLSNSPEEAVRKALDLRFIGKGRLGPDGPNGSVLNYDNRFEYGEDMLQSGKWGQEVTASLGKTSAIEGSRGKETVAIIPKAEIPRMAGGLRSGDMIYFVKSPEKRVVGEIVGHIGIIKIEPDGIYLIHASGSKRAVPASSKATAKGAVPGGGGVKKVPFLGYVKEMRFIGVRVGRFPE